MVNFIEEKEGIRGFIDLTLPPSVCKERSLLSKKRSV